jgi:hypothetical protein
MKEEQSIEAPSGAAVPVPSNHPIWLDTEPTGSARTRYDDRLTVRTRSRGVKKKKTAKHRSSVPASNMRIGTLGASKKRKMDLDPYRGSYKRKQDKLTRIRVTVKLRKKKEKEKSACKKSRRWL